MNIGFAGSFAFLLFSKRISMLACLLSSKVKGN